MNAPLFDYMLFGLRVRSELELPELSSADDLSEPDVWVRSAPIPIDSTPTGLSVHEGALLLTIDDVGRYRIASGSEIMVDPKPGVDPRNVRLFLLGSAFGALLHQRGLLPLHANAVEIEGKAVAFMGPSGAGKSTLAAWFHDQGYPIVADDVCVIRFERSQGLVAPGLPRLRLWRDALEASGRDALGFERSASTLVEVEKFDVPIDRDRIARTDLPLAAAYLLDSAEDLQIARLQPAEAAQAVIENTYRGAFVHSAGTTLAHWEACTALVRRTPIFRVSRSRQLPSFDRDAGEILAHAKAAAMAEPILTEKD